ncbi:hypothetical protein [Microbaculum marinum]|uniref:Uncharacterized protein n=1 Tax=Microbaculum marinum TaxID=1764581 RepID=A0AAW9RHQ5_9HYPH
MLHANPTAQGFEVILPATAGEAWLLSSSWVPHHHRASPDRRNLGVVLRHLTLTDDTGNVRRIDAADPRLVFGFHAIEGGGSAIRWTTGWALLPATLWAGMSGAVRLCLALDTGATRRWVAPSRSAAVQQSVSLAA